MGSSKTYVTNAPLVYPEKVLLAPLHRKLVLMKNFVKALDKSGKGFLYLYSIFSNLSDAKVIQGMFDKNFKMQLNFTKLAA
jgi:hypothetical protein